MIPRPILISWGMTICEKCGRIADVDIEVPDLRKEAASQSGYQITKTQMTVYGICPDCQKN